MKKRLALFMVCLLLLPFAVSTVHAVSSFDRLAPQNYHVMLNAIEKERIGKTSKALGPGPIGDTKYVSVTMIMPYDADVPSTYYYSDQYYEGSIPIVTRKVVVYQDGTKEWLVTYGGNVTFKR